VTTPKARQLFRLRQQISKVSPPPQASFGRKSDGRVEEADRALVIAGQQGFRDGLALAGGITVPPAQGHNQRR
jgi:hypothetical protein